MKANELRIGNYVRDSGGKILKIDWFERNKVCQEMFVGSMEVHPMTDYFGSIQPIPLTEEWLKKFGFKEVNLMGFKGCWQYPFDDKYFIQQMQNTTTLFLDAEKTQHLITAFDYVHQLQNLYFALSGEELTIKS